MPDRYWVGGSGSWNSTAKWSATSGGASGASVPTASDNVFFDANSGISAAHYTVTVTDNATCADLTFSPVILPGVTQFAVGLNFVIAGTFSTSSTAGNRRVWFRSSTYGLTRDMQIATIGTVTDVDFRDIRVTGAGGVLSGTRIGDLGGNFGVTFNAPKNCFRIGTGNWSDNQWAATSGGAVSTDNFPLAQDTAVFDESTTAGTHTMNSAIPYAGAVDMSARTSALTLSLGSNQAIHGSWTFGSGITISGAFTIDFEGRGTQVITSAGNTFPVALVVDSFGGTVELADALNLVSSSLTVINGTFDTKGYNVTAQSLSASGSEVRSIKLGASTVTLLASVNFTTSTNLAFDAGTSSIVLTSTASSISGGGLTFYDVTFSSTGALVSHTIFQSNIFNSITLAAPSSAGITSLGFADHQTITGTLSASGASAVRRTVLESSGLGSTRILTVGTLSADDCDFSDITIAGTAAGSSPTRAGDCGGNSGVNFPAPKTVYWNLAGTQNWSATAWSTTSGGTPALDNFPLAQDTAVFDNTGAAGTVNMQTFNIGSVDMSARTSAMTMAFGTPTIYGNWSWGSGVTSSNTGTTTFSGRGTSTITSGGNAFSGSVTINCVNGTVQLADALELASNRTLNLTSGTLDAVSYNVTTGLFSSSTGVRLRMGSGTWTLSGTGTVWNGGGVAAASSALYKGTADILLSNTGTGSRIFAGGGESYNKLTIGGATGTSTLTITGNNQFTELASTKTVAHTIALGTTTQRFGKWTVTGSAGNVVTLTGTGTSHAIVGSCTEGIDYLAMGSIGFSALSEGEFYAGANSTGTAGAPVYRTAKPADSVRYWVGGTGNWNSTTRWSTTSGGASGASLPRSHDDVVFDANSNATAYTATVNAITGGNRCKSLTISGPASGNVTLAGTTNLYVHDDITLPATGLTRTYTGLLTLTGSTAGKTLTTNGVALNSIINVEGVGAEWTLGSAADFGTRDVFVLAGSFDTDGYSLTAAGIVSNTVYDRAVYLRASAVSLSGTTPINLGTSESARAALTFSAGTSDISLLSLSPTLSGNDSTFHNVTATNLNFSQFRINGSNTFNNLATVGPTSPRVRDVVFTQDQTINGTLSFPAGVHAAMRTFARSDAVGATRTLTCAAFSGTDADFRDITIAGAAAPISGTRLGDRKGNTGIVFDAPKTVYYGLTTNNDWGPFTTGGAWSLIDGGATNVDNFPLPQDTAVFASRPNNAQTVTINAFYGIGNVDMSARTTNTLTLNFSSGLHVFGNWTNGTGTIFSGSSTLTFFGRTAQTVTSAGRLFSPSVEIDSPGGSVTLQDAITISGFSLTLISGTLDASGYNITLSNNSGTFSASANNPRTIALGSATLALQGSTWTVANPATLTVTGAGTISMRSSSSKTFAGGDANYATVTLDQGGAGVLTVSGNNTFANITNTRSAFGAATINFGSTSQRVGTFTASGEAGRILTIQGTSSTSPCALIHTGAGDIGIDYVTLTGVRAYQI